MDQPDKPCTPETTLEYIFNCSPDLIFVTDAEHTIIRVNQTLADRLGIPESEITGRKCFTCIHHTCEPPVGCPHAQMMLTGLTITTEEYLEHLKGWFSVVMVPSRDEEGKITGAIHLARDISERKKAEKELRESEEKYRLLADLSPEMIFLVDKPGTVIYVNAAAATAFHADVSVVTGKNLKDIFPLDHTGKHLAVIQKVLETKQNIHAEIEEDFPAGKTWIDVYLSPLINEKGEVIAVLGIANNITELKRSVEEIRNKNQELQFLNTEKDKFFSIIAHDLRSPFNVLLGLIRIMEKKLPTLCQEELQTMTTTLGKCANNLYQLLENLLEWSLLQRGITSFNPSSFSLLPKVCACIDVAMESAKNKEIRISHDIPADLMVFADEYMLNGILRNLLSNAVKFTARNGSIELTAISLADDSVQLSIKDSGIGMTKKMVDSLFDLEGKTNRKGTEGEPSTGLGLIICNEFIEKHGGKFEVESAEGQGTTFRFTLPPGDFMK